MRKKSIKILSLLLTLVMLVGVLPGMTAYAADTYTLTVTYGNTKIIDLSNYPLGYDLYISGEHLDGEFDRFWGDPTAYGIVSNVRLEGDSKFIIFRVNETGIGTLSGGYSTVGGAPKSYQFNFTCDKNAPAGYTVTYDPGKGSYSGDPLKADATKGEDGKYTHFIQKYEDYFTPPKGEHFDHWYCSDGNNYHYGDTINPVTDDLTLTAIWVPDSKPDSGSGGGSGSFVDLVFNIPGADNSWDYVGGGVAPQRAYRVSLAPTQGGSAYFLLNSGESGDTMNVYPQTTVRVVPTPAPGYRLASIVWSMIDGSASYDITETQTFVMPAMDAVVYVTFKPAA